MTTTQTTTPITEREAMRIKLTQRQWEALEHRLAVPDAIVDYMDDGGEYSEAELTAAADVANALSRAWNGRALDTTEADAVSVKMTDAVLRDCVEGSTWIGVAANDDETGRRALGAERTLAALADVLTKSRGWAVRPNVPVC